MVYTFVMVRIPQLLMVRLMTSADIPQAVHGKSPSVQTHWPKPLTPKEWDERYPGILDSLAIAGGGANIIMQLALPAVGYGVKESRVDSGAVFKHPIKRARTTFTYLAVAFLGTTEEKLAYRKAVSRMHAKVYSTESSPVKYRGLDGNLQLWVAACLFWGVLDTLEKFRGEVPPEKAAELMALAQPLATTLQVRPEQWPADIPAFKAYWENEILKLQIDDTIRDFLHSLIELKFLHPSVSLLLGPAYRFVTTGFLPPRIREEMHLEWSDTHQNAFDLMIKTIAFANKPLPRVVRQMPLYVVWWDFRRRLRKGLPLV